jgi:hypothetical protein
MNATYLNPADVEMIDVTLEVITELADEYIIETKTAKARAWFLERVHQFAVQQLGPQTTTNKLCAWVDEYFNL